MFGRGDYVVLKHGILVSPLEQLINGCGRMQRQRIEKLGNRANSLSHRLEDSVRAYGIELEDHGPKTFHKVPDGLRSPHPDVKKNGDALLSPDLSDELFRQAVEGSYRNWS